jgi:hypothetical protein
VRPAPLILVVALMSCADRGATITVTADEPIARARLVLNDKDVEVERLSRHAFTATWRGGEASGEFRAGLNDGTEVVCLVGYLEGTDLYREQYAIKGRQCEAVP